MVTSERSDEELMLAAQAGCIESFEVLVMRHRSMVIRFLLRVHPDMDLAEDSCQEAFLRAWLYRDHYTVSGKFTSYLLQIAKRVLLGKLRSMNVAGCAQTGDLSECTASSDVSEPENALLRNDAHDSILQCIEALPTHLGVVFKAIALDGLKYVEAAQRLSLPLGTVKSRMHAAVKQLRSDLYKEGLL